LGRDGNSQIARQGLGGKTFPALRTHGARITVPAAMQGLW
jgi:hypothetical protein